ncbi:hypothetical protein MKW98_029353 [Papaver atlanticum]|uniref:Uncharacterized protein n=1 Tax=Papaver atlanticum TaxID=357466 RepID=A0AAD4XGE1_9MAGN|nr:hypothetical protein MKW98_029353 [Papaver atlanticum]
MKNKQNTQQSPTDKTSPSESASLTSKLQTPPKTKSADSSLSPESRRSSPRNKKLAEDNAEPSPNTTQLRRTPRYRKVTEPSAAVSPTKCATTPKRRRQPESAKLSSTTTKRQATRKNNVQFESARHSQSTTTKSQSKNSKGDTENFGVGRKNVKRKLDTSSTCPCLNVQLRDPNDTLADLQDVEEEENIRTRKAVEEDNSNHVEPDVKEENDNGNDDEPELENGNSSERKYVPRGPTQMHALKLDSVDPKRTVPFNTNEQPISDPSVQLASVLGVLVRKLPLTFRDWRLVPHQAKGNIWKIVTNRFIVPEYYKDYYFSKMGTYLREARSRKAGLALDALDRLKGEARERRMDKLMPRTMTVREWEDFVKHVNSAEFRVKRLKMQKVHSKHTTPHTISGKGYARLELDLQKELDTTNEIDRANLWKAGHKQRKGKNPHPGVVEAFEKLEKAQAEHGDDCGSSVTDDILAKAFGEDKKTKGRLKGIGFGATRRKVVAQSHYKMMIRECQESCRAMNDRLVSYMVRSSKCVCNGVSPSRRSSLKASNNQEASTSRIVRCNERDSTHATPSPVRRPNEVQVPQRFQAVKLVQGGRGGCRG